MRLTILLLTMMMGTICNGQVIFNENFNASSIPVGWQNNSNATDGGWRIGSSQSLSSQGFGIVSNGTSIAATNDDLCNCDKANEYLVSSPIDLSTATSAVLIFDLFYGDRDYQGAQEDATVEISQDGVSWDVLEDLPGNGDWVSRIINLTDYVGNGTVMIRFKYHDGGGWVYGMAIDNVSIEVPNSIDANLVDVKDKSFVEFGKELIISGTVLNNGIDVINSLEIQYAINGGTPVVELFENLGIEEFTEESFEFMEGWAPTELGPAEIVVEILRVNGVEDEISENNRLSFSTDVLGEVIVPDKIVDIVFSTPNIKNLADFSHGLDKPSDLDFFPLLGKDELWVINQRNEDSGGSTVTISGASAETPSDFQLKSDGNAWHFMSIPTGIAFSDDNFNFATSPGVQDANHGGGTFTGPSLWSSDPEIYAQPSGGNGSHLDMLHGSPYSMGIAHEVDNVFWIYDDWNKDIVRYDFVDDHGPGNDDHSDGMLRRYKDIGIQRDSDIPNHMILDKATGWMYFVDNGNDRVMRLDINSGNVGNTLPEINEPLSEHVRMENFTVETVIEEGLNRPCGIEFFNGYLLVGDYANGSIIVYDANNDFKVIGTIETNDTGLAGIKVGPDGNIYAVNRITNSLFVVSEGAPTSTIEYGSENDINVFPNPADNYINIEINNIRINGKSTVTIWNNFGQRVYNGMGQTSGSIDVSKLNSGVYTLEVNGKEALYRKQFSIIR